MITLQAASGETAAIEWDETKTKITEQSAEAQAWVGENILNTEPVNTNETVHSDVEDVDWDRIKTQVYTASGYTLTITRAYKDNESCATNPNGTTYVLAAV